MSVQTPEIKKAVAEAQKQNLAALAQANEALLKIAETAGRSFPMEAPASWTGPLGAKDVVSSSYDFAGKVLAEQKAFAVRMTEVVENRVEEARRGVARALSAE